MLCIAVRFRYLTLPASSASLWRCVLALVALLALSYHTGTALSSEDAL